MKSPNFIIVKADQNYNNEKDNIIINSSIESVENINREVEVVSAPDDSIIDEGDRLIIHHNILRKSNDHKGNEVHSMFHIKDNLYFVPLSEVLMYDKGDGWKALDPFVFVLAIKNDDKFVGNFIVDKNIDSYKGSKKLTGVVMYTNESLERQGVRPNDTIYFTEFSEHEYWLNDRLCYKMKTEDILLKV